MREAVYQGASHQPHCRLVQVDGQESQKKNGGPAYYVTDQDQGKAQGDQALETNRYIGPAPVPLEDYWDWVEFQTINQVKIEMARLEEVFACPTFRANPVVRKLLKGRSRCHSIIRISDRRIINILANRTRIFGHKHSPIWAYI